MVKSTGRRGGLQSRWARGGGVLFLAGTLGWILLSAGRVIFFEDFQPFQCFDNFKDLTFNGLMGVDGVSF